MESCSTYAFFFVFAIPAASLYPMNNIPRQHLVTVPENSFCPTSLAQEILTHDREPPFPVYDSFIQEQKRQLRDRAPGSTRSPISPQEEQDIKHRLQSYVSSPQFREYLKLFKSPEDKYAITKSALNELWLFLVKKIERRIQ